MDGSNVGWWVPALTVAVPLFLLLALHLLARLEEWMFSSDERAAKVAQLLEHAQTPDEIEQEVSRMLAEVTDKQARASRTDERAVSLPRRSDRRAALRGRRPRLRRVTASNPSAERGDPRSG